MEEKIVLDSDNTLGIRGCDVDDGLALLYLVGDAVRSAGATHACDSIAGVCSSYGNSDLATVHANTQRILRDWRLPLPLYRGAERPGPNASDAARFIANAPREQKRPLALAVTGSTTNLLGALALDDEALGRYRQVAFMGGITETLVVGDAILDELNLSCDAEATVAAFDAANRGATVAVITANNCLPLHFTPTEFERELRVDGCSGGGYLLETCAYWFDDMRERYHTEGFCCWDVLVPLYLARPELFHVEPFDVTLDPRLIGAGYLAPARPGIPQARILLPRLRDAAAAKREVLRSWRAALDVLDVARVER
ncbi:nucleoside hydrolase [Eggerthella sinensis]|uniref:nucleoside hydrolase n=1 Tax=Eggerthella sinensis TaxID=242230 RepID=UPI0022DF7AC1|nr:nucleoside hydrolase [Eggerthella sinensis]